MGHNCKTCISWNSPHDYCSVPNTQPEFSQNIADKHPCLDGTPIVATAIADYQFYNLSHGDVHAIHCHNEIVYHEGWLYKDNPYWIIEQGDYCSRCGLRAAGHKELEAIFERNENDISNG